MALYHGDKRDAKVKIGHLLVKKGWQLFGYSEDKSDIQSDYFCPANWDGVATKVVDGRLFTVVVDISAKSSWRLQESGKPITKNVPQRGADCQRCHGGRADPSGWTFASAKASTFATIRFNQERAGYHGGRPMLADVLSPLHFLGHGTDSTPNELFGKESCRACSGVGFKYGPPKVEQIGTYATFQANPKGSNWHVEVEGRVIAKGRGLYVAHGPGSYEKQKKLLADGTLKSQGSEEFSKYVAEGVAKEIDDATGSAPPSPPAPTKPPEGDAPAVTVTTSAVNPQNVEITFAAKPDQTTRNLLKLRYGFRWSGTCWYGPLSKLVNDPAGIPGTIAAEVEHYIDTRVDAHLDQQEQESGAIAVAAEAGS